MRHFSQVTVQLLLVFSLPQCFASAGYHLETQDGGRNPAGTDLASCSMAWQCCTGPDCSSSKLQIVLRSVPNEPLQVKLAELASAVDNDMLYTTNPVCNLNARCQTNQVISTCFANPVLLPRPQNLPSCLSLALLQQTRQAQSRA